MQPHNQAFTQIIQLTSSVFPGSVTPLASDSIHPLMKVFCIISLHFKALCVCPTVHCCQIVFSCTTKWGILLISLYQVSLIAPFFCCHFTCWLFCAVLSYSNWALLGWRSYRTVPTELKAHIDSNTTGRLAYLFMFFVVCYIFLYSIVASSSYLEVHHPYYVVFVMALLSPWKDLKSNFPIS